MRCLDITPRQNVIEVDYLVPVSVEVGRLVYSEPLQKIKIALMVFSLVKGELSDFKEDVCILRKLLVFVGLKDIFSLFIMSQSLRVVMAFDQTLGQMEIAI